MPFVSSALSISLAPVEFQNRLTAVRYTAMSNIDASITYPTDCASLLIYDIDVARAAGLTDPDSWSFEYAKIDAVKDGRVSMASLGGDGVYKVRVTDGDLTPNERDYAADCLQPLGLRVESGRVCISGYWFDEECETFVDVPPGLYTVTLYDISFWQSPRWWSPDQQQTPPDAPADYVAILQPRQGDLTIPDELQLDYLRNWEPGPTKYLFGSSTRLVGPQVGMELVSTVRRSGDSFTLKDCGPGDYSASLTSFDGLGRSDRVRFRVVSVDHEDETLVGELIAKV